MTEEINFDPITHRTKTIGNGIFERKISTAEVGFKIGNKLYSCESDYSEDANIKEVERNLLLSANKLLEKTQKSEPTE